MLTLCKKLLGFWEQQFDPSIVVQNNTVRLRNINSDSYNITFLQLLSNAMWCSG